MASKRLELQANLDFGPSGVTGSVRLSALESMASFQLVTQSCFKVVSEFGILGVRTSQNLESSHPSELIELYSKLHF